MAKLVRKPKKLLALLAIVVGLTFALSGLQSAIINVSAQLHPIMFVAPEAGLEFGLSFPQEIRDAQFIVAGKNYNDTIHYRITHERKPLPDGYIGDGEDPEMLGYYRDLCPYLSEVTEERELDTPAHATVDPCQEDNDGYLVCGPDNFDYWKLIFDVPTIIGFIDQGFVGTPVDAPGDYGCDLKISFIPICNPSEELIFNGSFEVPKVTDSHKWDIFTSAQVLGWDVAWATSEPEYQGYPRPADAYLELHRGVNGWASADGSQHAELDSDWVGPNGSLNGEPASVSVYQDIQTVPGRQYTLGFYFSPRPNTDEANNQLEVSIDGVVKYTTSAAGGSDVNWSYHQFTFTATDDPTIIKFTDKGTSDSLGTFLDNVSLKCIPEPLECTPGQTQPCATGQKGICAAGTQTCSEYGYWSSCRRNQSPTAEVCDDGLDNDCDGLADCNDSDCSGDPACTTPPDCTTGAIQPCTTGLPGICAAGSQTCDAQGFWGSCVQNTPASNEICDGQDNDCDGQVDEGGVCETECSPPGSTQSCNTGAPGICSAGTQTCSQFGTWDICVQDNPPETEICDGFDNDCDGEIDEGGVCETPSECSEGEQQSCDTGNQGVCSAGTQTCNQDGFWGSCEQDNSPLEEVCNGSDDDCDGEIDEGGVCGGECTPEEARSCSTGLLGICAAGTQTCEQYGSWGPCVQDNPSETEICDAFDNDCDGEVNEGGVCETPPEAVCGDNSCNGEETCSTCPEDCGSCGGGGGGGGGSFSSLYIHTASLTLSQDPTSITINWFTNRPADSRVVYDTVSHLNAGSPPNYGYAWSTPTYDQAPKVTFHSVTINGLLPNTKYYFRPISAASPEVYGDELSFTIEGETTPPAEVTPPPAETPPTPPATGGQTPPPASETGAVAGVEYAEAAAPTTTEVAEEPTLEPTLLGQEGGSAPEETAKDCTNYIWLLLVLNLIVITIIGFRGKKSDNLLVKYSWPIDLIVVIVVAILWYPQCQLIIWLAVIFLIVAIHLIILVAILAKQQKTN